LLAGLLIAVLGKRLGESVSKIGIVSQLLVFAISLLTLYEVSVGPPIQVLFLPTIIAYSDVLQFGLYIDRLTAVMMVLIAGVSVVIHVFSAQYLQQDPGYSRFYIFLSFMTSVLFYMVASPNLLMLFIFWQLLSWMLYLLLAHNRSHLPSCAAALKTFIILRIGDVAFLGGIILAYMLYGTFEFPLLFERAAAYSVTLSLLPGGGLAIDGVTAVALLVFVGAMSKSTQFPLHVWLPDTMFGPTPVSALMHAGIVNSGGFILNRLAPLYGLSSTSLNLIFGIGALTTFLGASMMLCQNDVKKMLGYSTIAQMGYMVMECGLGAFALAIFHFVAHGLFKGTLFLSAGTIVHTNRIDPKLPKPTEITRILSAPESPTPFSFLTWLTGIITTLILPLIILLAAHDVFHIPLSDEAHGAIIFLFFAWVTTSQVVLSVYRMDVLASWKVVCGMVGGLVLITFTYLYAGEVFSLYLYPAPGEAAHYFEVAALHIWLFDLIMVLALFGIVSVWIFLYANARGKHILMPIWVGKLRMRFYVVCINGLYLDTLYQRISKKILRYIQILDKRLLAWLP